MQRVITKNSAFLILFVLSLFLSTTVVETKAQEENNTQISQSADEKALNELRGIVKKKYMRIINLGINVNTEEYDYAPTITADGKTLYFVSNREGSQIYEDGDPSHDFWKVTKKNRQDTVFSKPVNIDLSTTYGKTGVNTTDHEGAASIAADRQTLYFTGCSRPDGLGDCDLYVSTIEGDKWTKPVNLGRNVNTEYWDSQPSISPDQSRIYFISSRPGPNSDGDADLDNADIWYADWDPDLEEWKEAKNLTELNTGLEEASPFIGADGLTLFFASAGHTPNYGYKDFYFSKLDPATGKWSQPVNLGKPLNTEEDEQFITLPASGDILYFSSTREDYGGFQGELDLFMAFVPTFFRTTIVKGSVFDECSGEFIPAEIEIKNPVTGKVWKQTLTEDNPNYQIIVNHMEYGDPKDSINAINLEITATNPKYGKKTKAQRVVKPVKVEDQSLKGSVAEEIELNLTLGQRPVLATTIDEAEYIAKAKASQPELANFNGLVMEEIQTWDLYPLLNFVFFDLNSSDFPNRYQIFTDPSQTRGFTDTTVPGATLDKYYHVLNIYGFRLNQYPDEKIEIVGCIDDKVEKDKSVSKARAELVYNYFKNIWNIDESRMKLTVRKKPNIASNNKDSLGIQENRRVEILCKNWEVTKPVFEVKVSKFPQPDEMLFNLTNGIEDAIVAKRRVEITRGGKPWNTLTELGITEKTIDWDWQNEDGEYPEDEVPYTCQMIVTTKSGAECKSEPIEIPVKQVTTQEKTDKKDADSTRENYSLILFKFNSADAGPLNDRIMNDYVYNRIVPSSVVDVTGHTDVVGLDRHNQRLSERRAGTVERGINKATRRKYAKMDTKGVGENDPLYSNATPEGRFYNRTVHVFIKTPVQDAPKSIK